MKKKIIFFDGDGTLWYPKKTKRKKAPWWVYSLPGSYRDHNKHLILVPEALQMIKKLRKMGILTVILSTHPHPPEEAEVIINGKIKHFRLEGLFNEVHATKAYCKSKGEFIIKILKERNIPKNKALMVGDNYLWDYKPARDVGIDALLVESDYMKLSFIKRIKKIKRLNEIFNYI